MKYTNMAAVRPCEKWSTLGLEMLCSDGIEQTWNFCYVTLIMEMGNNSMATARNILLWRQLVWSMNGDVREHCVTVTSDRA
jgi:hypothetical protein